MNPFGIGPAVADGGKHRLELGWLDTAAIERNNSRNATHCNSSAIPAVPARN